MGGKEINAWRFGVVRLWEVEVAEALVRGAPGLLALVPMMSGGDRLEVIERAARSIERALPEERGSDAERILLLLAARRYTVEELARIIGRERMLDDILSESSIYQWMVAKGELNAERKLCLELIKKHHPALVAPPSRHARTPRGSKRGSSAPATSMTRPLPVCSPLRRNMRRPPRAAFASPGRPHR